MKYDYINIGTIPWFGLKLESDHYSHIISCGPLATKTGHDLLLFSIGIIEG